MFQKLLSKLTGRQSGPVRIRSGVGHGLIFEAGRYIPDFEHGTSEVPVQAVLAKHLREGQVFYDVGANVGFFTLLGASLVGKSGKVYAFEPVPANVKAIRHNLELNNFGHVEVFEKAVSDHAGFEELQITGFAGGSTLASAGTPLDITAQLTVSLVVLDDLLAAEQLQPPHLVKIDVEGAELAVLCGMKNILTSARPIIIFEVDDADPGIAQTKYDACMHFLQAYGYTVQQTNDAYPDIDWHVLHGVALPT